MGFFVMLTQIQSYLKSMDFNLNVFDTWKRFVKKISSKDEKNQAEEDLDFIDEMATCRGSPLRSPFSFTPLSHSSQDRAMKSASDLLRGIKIKKKKSLKRKLRFVFCF